LLTLLFRMVLVPQPELRAELTDAQKKDAFLKNQSAKSSSASSSSSSPKKKKKPSTQSSSRSGTQGDSKKHATSGTSSDSTKELGTGSSSGPSKKHSSSHSKSHHLPQTHHANPEGVNRSASSPEPSQPQRDAKKSHVSAAVYHPPKSVSPAQVPHTVEPPSPPLPPLSTRLPLPRGATPSAPITIEKSGVETSQGLEPVPAPEHSGHAWDWLFGSHKTYTYLSASTRTAIDRAPVRRGRWKYIVVHNSGTREGNARIFDIYHLRVRHMKNGLAYHFVIGDGHGSGDGAIEIGHRWTAQLNGGHVASDYLNDIALGVCLVGDFNRDMPTKAQIGALDELVGYLRDRVGKTQGRRAIVHAHKEINPKPTDCPGDRFPYNWLHARFGNAN